MAHSAASYSDGSGQKLTRGVLGVGARARMAVFCILSPVGRLRYVDPCVAESSGNWYGVVVVDTQAKSTHRCMHEPWLDC